MRRAVAARIQSVCRCCHRTHHPTTAPAAAAAVAAAAAAEGLTSAAKCGHPHTTHWIHPTTQWAPACPTGGAPAGSRMLPKGAVHERDCHRRSEICAANGAYSPSQTAPAPPGQRPALAAQRPSSRQGAGRQRQRPHCALLAPTLHPGATPPPASPWACGSLCRVTGTHHTSGLARPRRRSRARTQP